MNDISIIIGIFSLFLIIGSALPYLETEYNYNANLNIPDVQADINEEVEGATSVSIISVFLSILSMFFWTFGALPIWLDLIFIIFRVTFVLTIARNVWFGGGG